MDSGGFQDDGISAAVPGVRGADSTLVVYDFAVAHDCEGAHAGTVRQVTLVGSVVQALLAVSFRFQLGARAQKSSRLTSGDYFIVSWFPDVGLG